MAGSLVILRGSADQSLLYQLVCLGLRRHVGPGRPRGLLDQLPARCPDFLVQRLARGGHSLYPASPSTFRSLSGEDSLEEAPVDFSMPEGSFDPCCRLMGRNIIHTTDPYRPGLTGE